MAGMAEEMARLRSTTQALNEVSETLLASYKAITDNSANITAASTGYVEQMQALDRNIAGLNTIYEIQLRSVSGQLDAIERVNRGIKNISALPWLPDALCRRRSRHCLQAQETPVPTYIPEADGRTR